MRAAIDAIDTLQLALLGMRGRLAVRAGRAKHFAGLPGSDPEREA
ncbi:chorismate mutase, partial [Lysobacter defluvii IMMIB APB-9 = DSM 18482]